MLPLQVLGENASYLFQLLVPLWVPWLVAASLQSLLCLHLAFFLLCVFSFSSKDTSDWIYSPPYTLNLTLN